MPEISTVEVLKMKLAELRLALDKNIPGIANILAGIRMHLGKQEDLIHILKEEEIAIIVEGCSKQSGIVLQAAESKAVKSAKLKNMSAEDL